MTFNPSKRQRRQYLKLNIGVFLRSFVDRIGEGICLA